MNGAAEIARLEYAAERRRSRRVRVGMHIPQAQQREAATLTFAVRNAEQQFM
jgi:hypothetical protein